MASIKGITLKKINTFIGREGEGTTADIYIDNKKVGFYGDYADGSLEPVITIEKDYCNEFTFRVRQFYRENTPFIEDDDDVVRPVQLIKVGETQEEYIKRVPDVLERFLVSDASFFEALLLLFDYEKAFKKNAKRGYKHLVVIKDAVENNFRIMPLAFATNADGKALQKTIELHFDDGFIKPTATVYSSLEDFKI